MIEDRPHHTQQFIKPSKTTRYRRITNGTLHVCGFNLGRLHQNLFPEYPNLERLDFNTSSSSSSLLLHGLWGPCPGTFGKPKLDNVWISQHYRGKTVLVNGENSWGSVALKRTSTSAEFGSIAVNFQPVPYTTFLGIAFTSFYDKKYWPYLFDPQNKPTSTKERFCIYTASNCVAWREEAADRLAQIGTVHYGGKCQGSSGLLLQQDRKFGRNKGHSDSRWDNNAPKFSRYRFCLVMENAHALAYVTEKILNAFLGGCVPIYYGTEQVFDIFNAKAFVYYNITHPQQALDRIRHLEENQTAYQQVQDEPILAHGQATEAKYFSFTDDIGKGFIKQKIRILLGLSPS